MGLFESHVPIDSITIMVQKEVADRMQEGPGSKEYGALSLAVQYYAKPEIVVNVPPSCFMPQPKVGSAVIRLTRHSEPPVTVKSEKLLFQVIRASFNQRRKTPVSYTHLDVYKRQYYPIGYSGDCRTEQIHCRNCKRKRITQIHL